MHNIENNQQICETDIAIIGMAGRFPQANDINAYWRNLRNGIESVTQFTDADLQSIDTKLLNNPNYVKAGFVLENIELFAASFFDYSPREAEIMDPQQRIFLEVAWEALDNAGYNIESYQGQISVYASASINTYLLFNILFNSELIKSIGVDRIRHNNRVDNLATRVAYRLNLKGSAISVQTGCSSSLVGIHLACQSLLNYECDIALAGGVSISANQKTGYLYQEGNILSPDGHCRAFDAQAKGTVVGNGIGVVVLKRLQDAITDNDYIYAAIKGSAINNDGSFKVGYTAPSIDGQAKVITEALAVSRVLPETVNYIETHGTGTVLGDPIEIAALSKSFSLYTQKKNFCAIGAVKTNIGHLDSAAGVAGLIKTVLALKHKQIPPSLHFKQPNPQIDFDNSPFYVNTQLSQWETNGTPRRASVSSFGIGGTNAHVILEEAPPIQSSSLSRPWQLLLLSAKTESALETATTNLVTHLKQHPNLNLADVAYTLQVGRRAFENRRIFLCQKSEDAVTVLENLDPQRTFTHFQEPYNRQIIFMFSGQGSQYVNMGRELYDTEPVFRKHIDECCEILKSHLGFDLLTILYADKEQAEAAAQQLQQTQITQPALLVTEYALAQLFLSWGVSPEAMIGHSIGEYVAATIAGVFSLEDALKIVAKRGQLMQQLPTGSMLAIKLPEKDVQQLLDGNQLYQECLQIAVINSPESCVVSGTSEAVAALEKQLSSQEVECRQLHTSHAFHSVMMEPILEAFSQVFKTVKLNSPKIRFISNVTGDWITEQQATNPDYWCQHLRKTVRFSDGISQLIEQFEGVFLEVGPGRTLSTLTRQHLEKDAKQQVLTSLRHVKEQQSDVKFLLQTLGRLWLEGVEIDWSGFYTHEHRHRIPLPTYPFERQRYWIEPNKQGQNGHQTPVSLGKKPDIADWFYIPFWKPSLPPIQTEHQEIVSSKCSALVFIDECGLGSKLVKGLESTQNQDIIIVKIGEKFTRLSEFEYTINPENNHDYDVLIQKLFQQNRLPKTIIHLWNVTPSNEQELEIEQVDKAQATGFYSLLFLAQALGRQEITDDFLFTVISNNLQSVTGHEELCPQKATLLGPVKVISQEYSNINCCSIDVVLPENGIWLEEELIEQLMRELKVASGERIIAYRGVNRWVQSFEPVRFEKATADLPKLREKGVYLITGGLGGIGLVLAEYLAQTVQAKLVLVGRSALPEKEEWQQWLTSHDETDSTSRKIRKVEELERNGAEVLVVSADVSNIEQMQNVIAQTQQQFGQLNGVIHAAGVLQGKHIEAIENITKTDCEQQFKPKVHGLLVLEKVLQNQELDFCLLLSSLASILGGLGYVAYSAANIFMDAFVHQHNQSHTGLWNSISWDGWQLEKVKENEQNTSLGANLREFNIEPEEGLKAVQMILNYGLFNHIIVSTGNLQTRIKKWINLESLQTEVESQQANLSLHSRPDDLQNSYVAPNSEIEQKLSNIWQKILGIKDVGIYDNFFELGGDSLLAIQIISHLRETFQINFSLRSLFDQPTIADMSKYIEKTRDTTEKLLDFSSFTSSKREEIEL